MTQKFNLRWGVVTSVSFVVGDVKYLQLWLEGL